MTLPPTEDLAPSNLALNASAAKKRRFTVALGRIGTASWCRAVDGRFDEPQPTWSRLTGQTWEELAGMGWLDALHPNDRGRVAQAWREGAAEAALATRYRLRDALGRWRHITERSAIFDGADGLPPRAICVIEDNGDSERAEGGLRRAIDAAGVGAWELDLSRGTLHCSALCAAIHGLDPLEPVSLTDLALATSADDRELLRSEAIRSMADGQDFNVDYQVVWPDGSRRWVRAHGGRAPFGAAKSGLTGVCVDITDAKRREEFERERHAKTALESERKAEFLTILGHELRNPLAPIRNGLQAMRARDDDPAERERLRAMVERHVSHMAHLINDLRDVARLERGELSLDARRFDAREALRVAIEECAPLIEAKRHNFQAAGFDRPAFVHGDPTRLAQMVSNLLNNAAKYTPEGGEIGLKLSTSAGRLRVCVSDNGVGLDGPSLDRVFGMFEQVGEQKGRSDGGLGIGLALTRKLAELHGGSVTASSAGPGKGCRFLIDIPLGAEPEDGPARPAPIDLDALVVDDSADAAEMMALLLGMLGHRARVAGSGEAALAAAARRQPDVAFLDISMPGMDGHALARALRALSQGGGPALIALTGHPRESVIARAADFDGVLTKPAGLSEISKSIESAMRRRNG